MSDIISSLFYSYESIDAALEKEWVDLAVRTSAAVYLTCAWTRAWWEIYHNNRELRIFAFRKYGVLVGIVPIYIDRISFGLMRVSVARLVGANLPPRPFDPPIDKENAKGIINLLVTRLIEDERCDVVSFGPVSEDYLNRSDLLAFEDGAFKKQVGIKKKIFGVCNFFHIPKNFDDYFNSLPKNERGTRRAKIKMLRDDFAVLENVLTEPTEIQKELPIFIELHKNQWKSQKMLGVFDAWPKAAKFHLRLVPDMANRGMARLHKITADEKVVAFEYYFVFGDCSYWELSARVIGSKWDKYALGATGLILLIRHSIEEGLKMVDGGLGRYFYKNRLGGVESQVIIIRFMSMRPASRIKEIILRMAYYCVDIIYHKIWYRRLQPHLPAWFRRPIWDGWIRLIY